MEEIEIKFAVKDTEEIAQKLRKLGFRVTVARHLEKNYMFDNEAASLRGAGKLLRVLSVLRLDFFNEPKKFTQTHNQKYNRLIILTIYQLLTTN